MAGDREPREAAMTITSLIVGGDAQLEVFRRRRAGDPEVDLEDLRRARHLVLEVYRAIRGDDPHSWERIEQALALMTEPPPPESARSDAIDAEPTNSLPPDATAPAAAPPPERAPSVPPPARVGAQATDTPSVAPIATLQATAAKASPWGGPARPSPIAPPLAILSTPAPPRSPTLAPGVVSPAIVPPVARDVAPHEAGAVISAEDAPSPVAPVTPAAAPAVAPSVAPSVIPPAISPAPVAPAIVTHPSLHPPAALEPPPLVLAAIQPLARSAHAAAPFIANASPAADVATEVQFSLETTLDPVDNAGPVMPFASGGATAPEPIAGALEGHEAAGSTLVLDPLLEGETLPFADALEDTVDPHLRVLTVEQYASLCAETLARPSDRSSIHARYEVHDDDQRSALDAHWRARMDHDLALSSRFRQLLAEYERWARAQR